MSSISLKNVKKAYGKDTPVIENLNLEIKDGSFTVLVGPSGCGKSTTLRMITGLETVTSGDILIDGARVNDVAPGKRDISMVFQNYALYPTMTVRDNIEFGLINKKIPKEERDRRIKEVCEVVGLTEYLDRMPANLSGGQRQRVALARAMVKEPKVFMMDEPLSNLDAKLRGAMRVELINMHKKMGTTFVYVTHDQVEAMSMATDIVLMDKGKIVQQSSPAELYHNPNCIYTAQFVGSNIPAKVATREMLGSEIIYSLETKFGVVMCKTDVDMPVDTNVKFSVAFDSMYLFGADTYRIPFTEELKKEIVCVFR